MVGAHCGSTKVALIACNQYKKTHFLKNHMTNQAKTPLNGERTFVQISIQ